jgi:hypothetical protein
MTRPGKTAGLLALLAALLIGSPAPAQEEDSGLTLKEQVRKLRRDLYRLERQQEEDRHEIRSELRRIAAQLDRIEQQLARMPTTRTDSTSRFGDPDAPFTTTPMGTLRLDNRTAFTAVWTIDGVAYRVPPGGLITVSRRAGPLTYSLRYAGSASRAIRTTTVRGSEMLTLYANP